MTQFSCPWMTPESAAIATTTTAFVLICTVVTYDRQFEVGAVGACEGQETAGSEAVVSYRRSSGPHRDMDAAVVVRLRLVLCVC